MFFWGAFNNLPGSNIQNTVVMMRMINIISVAYDYNEDGYPRQALFQLIKVVILILSLTIDY